LIHVFDEPSAKCINRLADPSSGLGARFSLALSRGLYHFVSLLLFDITSNT